MPTRPTRSNGSGARIVEGDLRDRELMPELVAGQDLVFNLSGQSGAVRSMDDPWSDLDINLRGNLVLLESLARRQPAAPRSCSPDRGCSTASRTRLPVGEDDGGDPLCVHAIHKRTVEEYLKLYAHLFGLDYSIARITNPYGPGQPKGRTAYGVINRLIHLALADEALTIYGDGAQLRDYVHVGDVVDALLLMADSRAGERPRLQRRQRRGHPADRRGERRSSSIAGGGRIEHVAWPALAQQIETGDFVADISRAKRELGWAADSARFAPGSKRPLRTIGARLA